MEDLDPPQLLPGHSGDRQLAIGDVIALTVQRGGRCYCVGSEGFIDVGLALRPLDLSATVPWDFVDCQWEVTQKHQYDAQKNVRRSKKQMRREAAGEPGGRAIVSIITPRVEAEGDGSPPPRSGGTPGAPGSRTNSPSPTKLTKKKGGFGVVVDLAREAAGLNAKDEEEEKRRQAEDLLTALASEQRSNTARNEEKYGTPLTYGETVQLRHVKSRKYLMINPKRRSASAGGYSIALSVEGSEDSWLSLGPCYSFQFEGGGVYDHEMLQLHSTKRQLYLNVGHSTQPGTKPAKPKAKPKAKAAEAPSSAASAASTTPRGAAAAATAPAATAPATVAAAAAGGAASSDAVKVAAETDWSDTEVNASAASTAFQLLVLHGAAESKSTSEALGSNGGGSNGGGGGSAALGGSVLCCGDILAFFHCVGQRHLIASWALDSEQDPVVFRPPASAANEIESPPTPANALWQVQPYSGVGFEPLLQGSGYCLQHLASGRYLTVVPRYSDVAQAATAKEKKKASFFSSSKSKDSRPDAKPAAAEGAATSDSAAPAAAESKSKPEPKPKPDGKSKATGAGATAAAAGAASAAGLDAGPSAGSAAEAPAAASVASADDLAAEGGGVSRKVEAWELWVRPRSEITSAAACLFELHDAQCTSKFLPPSCLVRLKHPQSGMWLTCGPRPAPTPPLAAAAANAGGAKADGGGRGAAAGGGSEDAETNEEGCRRAIFGPECLIRDGLLVERPSRVTATFLAVAGVTHHLLNHARQLSRVEITGNEPLPATSAALTYLTTFITAPSSLGPATPDPGLSGGLEGSAPSKSADPDGISVEYLQDVMRELGVIAALLTMLTTPFKRLGSVAFHKLTFDKPLLPRSKLAATLLWHSIKENPTNCANIYGKIPSLELAARKGIGIGQVLQDVFQEVPVDPAQIDFWFDLLHKARRGAVGNPLPDYAGGAMILSLFRAFCFRRSAPVMRNQNVITLKLMLSPASNVLDHVQVGRGGAVVGDPQRPIGSAMEAPTPLPPRGAFAGVMDAAKRTPAGATDAAAVASEDSGAASQPGPGGEAAGATPLAKSTPRRKGSILTGISRAKSKGVLTAPTQAEPAAREEARAEEPSTSAAGAVIADPARPDPAAGALVPFTPSPLSPHAGGAGVSAAGAAAAGDAAGAAAADDAASDAGGASVVAVPREKLTPLPRAKGWSAKSEVADPNTLIKGMLSEPAMLCVVSSQMIGGVRQLALEVQRGKAIPLGLLRDQPELFGYYLAELKLLGGLCAGFNGLSLSTARQLYPFGLCLQMATTPSLSSELRASVCVLLCHLYIEAPARRDLPVGNTVWDWEKLGETDAEPHASCLSLPGACQDTIAAAAAAATPAPSARASGASPRLSGRRKASENASSARGGKPKADREIDNPISRSEVDEIISFVSSYLLKHAMISMESSNDLELLAGVLDVTLHLLKGGHLLSQSTIEKIFEVLVDTLSVPQRRRVPTGQDSDDYANQLFEQALTCKALICHILDAALTYRLIVRTGTVLRDIHTTCDVNVLSKGNFKRRTSLRTASRIISLFGTKPAADADAAANGYAPLIDEEEEPPSTPAPAPAAAPSPALSTGGISYSSSSKGQGFGHKVEGFGHQFGMEGGKASRKKHTGAGAEMHDALRRGCEVLVWQEMTDNMIRALVQTTMEARETKPGLVADALKVLFGLFNQAARLTESVASAIIVKRLPPPETLSGALTAQNGSADPSVSPRAGGVGGVGGDADVGAPQRHPIVPLISPPPPPAFGRVMEAEGAGENSLELSVSLPSSPDGSRPPSGLPSALAEDVSPMKAIYTPDASPRGNWGMTVGGGTGSLLSSAARRASSLPEQPSPIERNQALLIGQTVAFVSRIAMSLRAFASTEPTPYAASTLSNLRVALRQLSSFCTNRHQRLMMNSFGAHTAVVEALAVLQEVEGDEGVKQERVETPRGVQVRPPGTPTPRASAADAEPSGAADEKAGKGHRLPPTELLQAREEGFDFLASFCGAEGDPFGPNQEALFPHFRLVLDHMARVKRATTCAQRLLQGCSRNCASVTDEHLNVLVGLMVGTARYCWYIDVLLSLARALPDSDTTLPCNILRKLIGGGEDSYLIVLYSGAMGREKRARELVSLTDVQRQTETGLVYFHHAVVQLLAELAAGLANEVEMMVQSLVPLHEVCAHICDALCPYQIRASFVVLLMEVYTVTSLKVQALVQSPAVWQVLAVFNAELRSLLECTAGHGDEADMDQAVLALAPSSRGPCFIDAGLWFCIAFVKKHAALEVLQADHKSCLSSLRRIASRLLLLTSNPKRRPDGSPAYPHLLMRPSQAKLLSAITRALEERGIGAGSSMWRNAGSEMGLKVPVQNALRKAKLSGLVTPKPRHASSPLASSSAKPAPASGIITADHYLTPQAPATGADTDFTSAGRGHGGAAADGDVELAGTEGSGAAGSSLDEGEGDNGLPSSLRSSPLLAGAAVGSRLRIQPGDTGLVVGVKLASVVEAARKSLEDWAADEFHRSVVIFKESGRGGLQPIVEQLTSSKSQRDPAEAAVIHERGLRVLQALLSRPDVEVQNELNSLGATHVMLHAIEAPATPAIFEAALELGISLLDGGNPSVQKTIYANLSVSNGAALNSLARALTRECKRFLMHHSETKQHTWYARALTPSGKEIEEQKAQDANDRLAELRRDRGGVAGSGSGSPIRKPESLSEVAGHGIEHGGSTPAHVRPLSETPDPSLAKQILVFLELSCEGHYAEMQNYLREQEGSRSQINLVLDLVNALILLERTLSPLTISLACQLYQTLIELVQGPCPGNQLFLIGTNLCDVAVRFMHGQYPGCSTMNVIQLKVLCLKLLLAMVEGVQTSVIPRRISSSLDLMLLVNELDIAFRASGDGNGETDEELAQRDLGFYIFLLMKTLSRHSPAVIDVCKLAVSYPFFAANTGSIEIVRQDKSLEEVYFPVPVLCIWLSEASKERCMWEVDRSTPQKRVEDFVMRGERLIHEMAHNFNISKTPLLVLSTHSNAIHNGMFLLSCCINTLVIGFTEPAPPPLGYHDVRFTSPLASTLVTVLGSLVLTVATASLVEHCVSQLPLTLRAAWADHGVALDFPSMWPLRIQIAPSEEAPAALAEMSQNRLRGHVALWTPLLVLQHDWWLLYYLLYLLNCVMGLAVSPFFFVVTLLDMVVRSRLLQKVIEAVTVNKESLSLTFMLVAVVIYQFTVIGQLFFREDYVWHYSTAEGATESVDLCATTRECFMATFYLGLSYGGLAQGLQDIRDKWVYDPSTSTIRWVVDLLFFIAVIVMLLNIIFGIVIDTFAQQRDMQKQIKDNMENICFVCGIDRNTFDRKHPIGFEFHTEHEHNIWHYLSFIIHLRKKERTEYTGPESYVDDMLAARDFGFFPILKTSSIIVEDVSNESLRERIDLLTQTIKESHERLEAQIESALAPAEL